MQKLISAIRAAFLLITLMFMCVTLQISFAQAADSVKPLVKPGKSIGSIETEYPSWFHDGFLDFNEDLASAKAAGNRLMIIFSQDGCPYCNALVERNLAQKDIEELVRKNFVVIAINMLGDRDVTHLDGKIYTEKSFAVNK
jgi:thioredoxin-related protein